MKLSKKEMALLTFARNTSIGTIAVHNDKTNAVAFSLTSKGLMFYHQPVGPFSGNIHYWSLTSEGWGK